jgi:multidrug efflux pump subunit AcrB
MIQLPAGATQERTQKVLDQVTQYYLTNEKANVESVFTVNGFSFSGQGQTQVWHSLASSPGMNVAARKIVLKRSLHAPHARSARSAMG